MQRKNKGRRGDVIDMLFVSIGRYDEMLLILNAWLDKERRDREKEKEREKHDIDLEFYVR